MDDLEYGVRIHIFFDYCIKMHWKNRQLRKKQNIPYYFHLSEVMKKVLSYGVNDLDVLLASLGHDLLEDTDADEEKIENMTNEKVLSIIKECTRPNGDNVSKKDKLEFLKSFKNKSTESLIIKFADRYCNVYDYFNDGDSRYASKYALQAYPIYNEIYNRSEEIINTFGNNAHLKLITKINELRDIIMTHLYPIEFYNNYLLKNYEKIDEYLIS